MEKENVHFMASGDGYIWSNKNSESVWQLKQDHKKEIEEEHKEYIAQKLSEMREEQQTKLIVMLRGLNYTEAQIDREVAIFNISKDKNISWKKAKKIYDNN